MEFIKLRKDVLARLKEAGCSQYRLYEDDILSRSTITRLKNGEGVSKETVAKICELLKCREDDLKHD